MVLVLFEHSAESDGQEPEHPATSARVAINNESFSMLSLRRYRFYNLRNQHFSLMTALAWNEKSMKLLELINFFRM
jgi:hypothetical protein